jgi:hypothetical protein
LVPFNISFLEDPLDDLGIWPVQSICEDVEGCCLKCIIKKKAGLGMVFNSYNPSYAASVDGRITVQAQLREKS